MLKKCTISNKQINMTFFPLLKMKSLYLCLNTKFKMIYCGIFKIRGGQFSWFVNFLQVRGDVILWISWLGEGGERKDNSGKVYFIWNELSFFTMVNDDETVIASQEVDLKMSTVKPLHAYWAVNTHNLVFQSPELIRSCFRKVGLLSDYWHY